MCVAVVWTAATFVTAVVVVALAMAGEAIHLPTPSEAVHLPTPPEAAHLPTPSEAVHLPTPSEAVHLPTPSEAVHLPTSSEAVHLPTSSEAATSTSAAGAAATGGATRGAVACRETPVGKVSCCSECGFGWCWSIGGAGLVSSGAAGTANSSGIGGDVGHPLLMLGGTQVWVAAVSGRGRETAAAA